MVIDTVCVALRLTLMTKEVATPSCVPSNLHSALPFKTKHTAHWEVIAKEAKKKKTLSALPNMWAERRAGNC